MSESSVSATDEAIAIGEFVLTVAPDALGRVLEIRDTEEDPGSICLRVEITGSAGVDYTYDLGWATISELDAEDDLSVQGGLSVVVAANSIDTMRGAMLDLPRASSQGGFVIKNPNRPAPVNPLEGRDIELTGDIPDKVTQLLEEVINPGLAQHGGFAALVGVDDTTVFLTMGGGCQGCAMSAATLRDGITASIYESIPEVTDVVDVTDHNAGDNPFYT
ncbi:MAG: NifU family protein [Actinomycetota bacterium]